jgi:muramoyltetrapeptide carboxypeptidase
MPLLSSFQKPRALSPGDPVVVIAPASPFDRASFSMGLKVLSQRYAVRHEESLFASERYLAGNDSRRLRELLEALSDGQTRAVFAARGGYGVMRVLAGLAESLPPEKHAALAEKLVVGFSDLTALHGFLQGRHRVSIHGPVMTQLGRMSSEGVERLFSLLESPLPSPALHGSATYSSGVAEGPLVGGNLAVLASLLGTPFMPPLTGGILLLEDIGERPYRLDRMWTHLALAGAFRQVRGIVLGDFVDCEEKNASYWSSDVLRELAVATGLPCAAGFPIGHADVNEAVPLGVQVRLDADACTLTFLDGAVSPRAD